MTKQTHIFHLAPLPFSKIVTNSKIIESRLYDHKRRQIQLGDTIEFVNDQEEKVQRTVTALMMYPSFAALMHDRPAQEFGWSTPAQALTEIEQFYSQEDQHTWGVIGIKLGETTIKHFMEN